MCIYFCYFIILFLILFKIHALHVWSWEKKQLLSKFQSCFNSGKELCDQNIVDIQLQYLFPISFSELYQNILLLEKI